MKDIELLDILFHSMYENGDCKYMDVILQEAGVSSEKITGDSLLKLHGLLKSSGFVEELNYRIMNRPTALRLNREGYNMMLLHGSYSACLKAREKEKAKDEKLKKAKIRSIYVNILISLATLCATLCLSEPIKKVLQIFLSIFQ
jgi:hypothetical protein